MADNMLKTMANAAITKLTNIRRNHAKYTLTTDAIKANLSIDYTTVKLKKECKSVIVYYSGETIAAYRKLLNEYQKVIDDKTVRIPDVTDLLDTYVLGWSTMKVVTGSNLENVENMIRGRLSKIHQYQNHMDELMADFRRKNEDIDGMVDSVNINLFKYTTDFPYRRAYANFFKRQRVNEAIVQHHIADDIQALDRMIELLNILYSGWEKTGKDDSFDKFREVQHRLILAIQSFADVLEADIELFEFFTELDETVINFKVYPK